MKITRITEENWIEVIGGIWWPYGAICAQRIDLSASDVENIGEPTRDNVAAFVATHSGDFSSIDDFHAVVGETDLPWASEDSEWTFVDCMHPVED